MPGRAVWDLRPTRRILRSVRSLRACRQAAPPPSQPPQPTTAPAQANPPGQTITDAEMVNAIWYALSLDHDVQRRVFNLLERARKELGYA